MNLTLLRKSRPKLKLGDIFVMLPPVGGYLFGRVINVDANVLGVGGGILVYIYKVRAATTQPIPELERDQLLLPPRVTNRRPWTMGYFEHVEHRELRPIDRFSQHCFRDDLGRYFDEVGNRLAGPSEPIMPRVLSSFRTIDDAVSKALGIPLSPEEETLKA